MIAVGDVAVTVRDARASAQWWREKLGFDVHVIGPPDGHALMVAPAGERFILHLCEGFGEVEPGNTGISFVTDDLAGTCRRLEAKGVCFPEPGAADGSGRIAKFADPDGNVFWLLGAPASFIRAQTRRRAKGGPPPRGAAKTGGAGRRRRARD
jgi:catechol 2,3-dioxygenase-like lactoylglutathione lyase family enzyme